MVYFPHWPKAFGFCPTHYDLERITQLMHKLGRPDLKMPPVVHIGGTNGKGSTAAVLLAILRCAGLRVHRYTSPHLINFNERIFLANADISDAYLYEIAEECRIAATGMDVSYFEGSTACAFLAFSRVPADIVIVEVGMGGRLDATNIVEPILSVITTVALDHTEYLGDTEEKIAVEKSGIMKNGVPCVIAPNSEGVMEVLSAVATVKSVPVFRGGIEWIVDVDKDGYFYESVAGKIYITDLSLKGCHQFINAGNALAAISVLTSYYGYSISINNVTRGLSSVQWPARLEEVSLLKSRFKLPKHWSIVIDGAHNPSGAAVVRDWIIERKLQGKIYMIFGMTKGKDIGNFISKFTDLVCVVYAVCVESEMKAYPASVIHKCVTQVGIDSVIADSIGDAVIAIIKKHGDESEGTILICGSLFLYRDLRLWLQKY